jgi:hypothetical protein
LFFVAVLSAAAEDLAHDFSKTKATRAAAAAVTKGKGGLCSTQTPQCPPNIDHNDLCTSGEDYEKYSIDSGGCMSGNNHCYCEDVGGFDLIWICVEATVVRFV